MKKNVGLTYVSEFSFPAEQGFTGSVSSGVHQVKGYQRGGPVKKMAAGGYYGKPGDKYPALKSGPKGKQSKMPKNVKMKGGEVHAQMGGSVGLGRMGSMGQDREITVDDVTISVPKKHGGKMSVHDKLKHEGAKMGYAYGGQVKGGNTSSEFVQKRSKQKTMDTGNQPARRGRNQAEIEAGGTKRLKPGLSHGGGVHRVRAMPKNVKAHGGLMEYAEGGYAEGGKWIQGAIKKPGSLRKSLGVKKGRDIPAKKLVAAARKPGKMGRRARLAETLKGLNKAEGGSVSSPIKKAGAAL